MVRAIYTAVLVAGIFLMAPVFLVRALRHRKYIGSLRERLGHVHVRPSAQQTLWIHAVSVGEVLAAEPFVRAAARGLPGWRVVLSTTTATGQRIARERFPDLDVFYFPLDVPGAVQRTMRHVRPAALCLVETEIWPNVLAECRRRAVPVAIVNGRLSDSSFRGYSRVQWLLRGVLADVSRFLMQSVPDAKRVIALGASPERVVVAGNMKYDVDPESVALAMGPRRADVERALGFPDDRPLVVAGSTAPGEEAVLFDAFETIRRRPGLAGVRLLVAPRHPERFDDVANLASGRGFRVARRSGKDGLTDGADADVLILDSIGELAAAYGLASVVFVGGSIAPKGGHNILEPAMYARPIVVGPHTENFRQVVGDFAAAGAVLQLSLDEGNAAGLAAAVAGLLEDPDRARSMGDRGFQVLEANRGATRRTLDAVRAMLPEPGPS